MNSLHIVIHMYILYMATIHAYISANAISNLEPALVAMTSAHF